MGNVPRGEGSPPATGARRVAEAFAPRAALVDAAGVTAAEDELVDVRQAAAEVQVVGADGLPHVHEDVEGPERPDR